MKDTKGLVTLKDIVDDVMLEKNIDESEYVRMLRFAERGLAELSQFVIPTIKTITLTVDFRTNSASLPTDYIDYSRIGVIKNGDVYPLSNNPNLQLNKEIDCEDSAVPKESTDSYNEKYHYATRGGHSQYGEYRFNLAKHRIEFDSNASYRELVLEYVSSGVSASGDTYVPYKIYECIIAWIKWKYTIGDKDSNRIDIQQAKQDYHEEYLKVRDKYAPSLQEMMDYVWNTRKLTV